MDYILEERLEHEREDLGPRSEFGYWTYLVPQLKFNDVFNRDKEDRTAGHLARR